MRTVDRKKGDETMTTSLNVRTFDMMYFVVCLFVHFIDNNKIPATKKNTNKMLHAYLLVV